VTLHFPAPTAPAVDGEPKYLLFERYYVNCVSCLGWDEFFRGMNYDDTPNGLHADGRKHHSHGCPRRKSSDAGNPAAPKQEIR
jgi:hypothetical protein